jgi:hypothetical protein
VSRSFQEIEKIDFGQKGTGRKFGHWAVDERIDPELLEGEPCGHRNEIDLYYFRSFSSLSCYLENFFRFLVIVFTQYLV